VRTNLVGLVVLVLLGAGVLGFIPGFVTGYDAMTFAGRGSTAALFGVFTVSTLGNLIHLALGIIGMAMARNAAGARRFLILGGWVLILLAVYGWIIELNSVANVVPFNRADNWLHLGLGAAMLASGYPRRQLPSE
jgi:hypothetical protein